MSSAVASVASASIIAPSIAAPIGGDGNRPDPIFAAIEYWLEIEQKCDEYVAPENDGSYDEDEFNDVIMPEFNAARLGLAETIPTTLAGLAAYACFLNDRVVNELDVGNQFFYCDGEMEAFLASLNRSLAALSGKNVPTS
jgi:hypothetical protein